MSEETMFMDSPVGKLEIKADLENLLLVRFAQEDAKLTDTNHPVLHEAKKQIHEYFNGDRTEFELPLKLEGTDFQREVWAALSEIPFGRTCSYQDIAERINRPKAVRAIGQANKANKFPIIIPCHRVIGKDKSLTGYAGRQIDKKEILLSLEHSN
ncbi:methylated-DNA--[protein]-cysteine S-methyltransferase [Rossellomorea aquimaris]|uniref:methylated-DNA--[protein]-cysteine S-methyltransferase n=1 Tax=Rossellomorea aquimaris TaxID=189382 RepID=UPI001CD37CAF|nr:methylated-DNA--[protein]-cysteine S-methyltransferase [Rossellomorea aquimaris]MCA1056659.1 methylated-DNA--[protein]-cysteine S-methyltransferase [Rossellomorea aquimaris]